ncbi:hypothetical protein LGL55_14070 [Clostridium tagluense]|uniref:hypothetical protein n=2 Tax=Clostridium tagluense TaxID=360422 RepID=UPI001CF3DA20|nr:hypothetical protein [Clostridium tagluense]MCB2336368.1 hypothetical protein [Clostridium tagluense]MCB2365347.1 hypothetical protein [Clostridium tagluense]
MSDAKGMDIIMKRTIKIFKAFWFMYPSNTEWLLRFCIFFTGLISITICYDTTRLVQSYVNIGTMVDFKGIVLQLLNLINLSYIFILSTKGANGLTIKVTSNLNNFLMQAPVLKKDIYNVKFGIFQMVSIPYFIVVIYFIGLNIFVSTSELISAYSGFFVFIYCIWTMTVNISIGFSSLSSNKYKPFRYLFPALLLIMLVFMFYLISLPKLQPGTLINQQNIFSGLGTRFIPILKACRYIGGVSGLIVMLISTIISYLIGCKLPLKISEKVGN